MQSRFEREVAVLKELQHPYIVGFRDYVEEMDTLYLVIDVIQDGSLRELLEQRKKRGQVPALTLDEVSRMLYQIGGALDYAHDEHKLLHRDIKPENILLDTESNFHLTDFGAISIAEATRHSTGILGTIGYISPERFNTKSRLTRQSDIYSLGIVRI